MKIRVLLVNEGIRTSVKRVSRLMKEIKIVSVYSKKYTHYNFIKSAIYNKDLAKRDHERIKPNKVWVSDITYFYVNYKPNYLCVIIDLFSRKKIAFNVFGSMETSLVTNTLSEEYELTKPVLGLKFHSG